jgi:5,10-methylenetetrahydromethanopterin reductase
VEGAELWTAAQSVPGYPARRAKRLEAEGWTGMGVVDSQSLSGDVYVALALAGAATDRLQLGSAVTNSATRHPAVTAAAAATVQAESNGRFVLGIARGDSALAHLGLAPAPLKQFEHYLARLQAYLRGDEVPFDLETDAVSGLRSADTLQMDAAPKASRLTWMNGEVPKVPVDVAASGPKVIEIGARHADAITFAVGADTKRIWWAIDLARSARVADGLDPATLGLGAYLPLAVDPDRRAARELLRGVVGSYARFSVMHGRVAGPVADAQRESLTAVHRSYDMGAHFTHGSAQSQQLTDDVIDSFTIAGPTSYCLERLAELHEMGLRRFFLIGPAYGADLEAARDSYRRIVNEILPAVLA